MLFEQGDDGVRVDVVESGTIEIFRGLDGTEVRLTVVGPGNEFGELARCSASGRRPAPAPSADRSP